MILPLFRRPGRTIAALYGAIVAQARAAHFYAEMGVPDTVSGRFDMVLEIYPTVRQALAAISPEAAALYGKG